MPTFYAIVAMSENRAISYQNKLPWKLPEEYRWLEARTNGGTLIMGRKTRKALGKALPQCKKLVVSRSVQELPDSTCYSDLETLCADLPTDSMAWVFGGESIYEYFLEKCSLIYLSRIKREVQGDVFFPKFEHLFELGQIIHENADFRVERWRRKGTAEQPAEPWPLS
jgi:dihydrofolate reductase